MSIQTEIDRINANIAAAYTALAAKGATMPTAQNSDNLEATINSISMESGMTTILLWTNPNPTSSFAAQTVALDLSEYKAICIETKLEAESSIVAAFFIPVDGNRCTMSVLYNSRGVRHATATVSGVIFTKGLYASSGSATLADKNTAAIPQRIYGIG